MDQTQSLGKQILFWGAIVVGIGAVVAGMIYLVSLQQNSVQPQNLTIESNIRPGDWYQGNPDAKVKVIEYADFQCPACGYFYPLIKKLGEEFASSTLIIYRHFPLSGHPYSRTMAYAAEAAGIQNKFWEMHDVIFENQLDWTNKNEQEVRTSIGKFAQDLGLDMVKFDQDFESEPVKNKVAGAYEDAVKTGVSYTPSIFINGELIKNPGSYEALKDLVTQALNENQ